MVWGAPWGGPALQGLAGVQNGAPLSQQDSRSLIKVEATLLTCTGLKVHQNRRVYVFARFIAKVFNQFRYRPTFSQHTGANTRRKVPKGMLRAVSSREPAERWKFPESRPDSNYFK